jgi:Zn-dependent protease
MFSNAIKLFSLNRFDIKLDPSWFIIASLVTWSLSQQYFPGVLTGQTKATYLLMAVIGMTGLFGSLLLHELGHSVVARHQGVPIKSITLFIFGGMAEMAAEPATARDEFVIALAGPVVSLCLAAGFWIAAHLAALGSAAPAFVEVISYLAFINLVLALFNLVPAFPLDGGRILRAYLWHRTGNALTATRTATRGGVFFAYALMGFGVLALFQGAIVAGIWQLLIGAFVLVAARASYAAQRVRTVFNDTLVSALMTPDHITVSPEMPLYEFVHHVMLPHRISFAPVLEGDVLLGHIDQSVLSHIDRENWSTTRVGDVFVGLDDAAMITPDLGVPALLERIAQTNRRKFMVVKDHQLLGVITLADLAPHIPDRQTPKSRAL